MDAVSLKLARNYTNEKLNSLPSNAPTKTVSFDGGIYSVGNDVVNGQVSVTVKGRTLKNELNYNRETWEEWRGLDPTFVVNNYLVIEGNEQAVQINLPTDFKPDTKYGVLVYVRSNNRTSYTYISLPTANRPIPSNLTIYEGETGNFKFTTVTATEFIYNQWWFYAGPDSGKIELGDLRVFELPEGSEIENDFETMTADQLALKYPYISGDDTKSTVSAIRLTSKNEDETEQSTQYITAKDEEGNIAELRSLPNGTKDEVRVSEGKLIKRVSDKLVLNGSENWTDFRVFDNTYRMGIDGWTTNNNAYQNDNYFPAIALNEDGEYKIDTNIGIADERSIGTNAAGDRLLIRVEKEKIDAMPSGGTLAGFKEYLNKYPVTLIYQLAQPIITKLPAQPPLQVYENGTVYVEPLGDPSETTLPTVELTVPIAGGNKVGIATHDYAGAAADWVLTNNESKCKSLLVTNAGEAANIIAPDKPGLTFTIKNGSGQAITIKISGGTGVTVTAGKKVTVQHFGTDYEAISSEI